MLSKKTIQAYGWKSYITSVSSDQMTIHDALLLYRDEYRVERIFNCLKSTLNIATLFVKLESQILGMNNLLMLGIRILTLIEYVVRRENEDDSIPLSKYEHTTKKKVSDTPTAEKRLQVFGNINVTLIYRGDERTVHVTSLTDLQKELLHRLKINPTVYECDIFNKTSELLTN